MEKYREPHPAISDKHPQNNPYNSTPQIKLQTLIKQKKLSILSQQKKNISRNLCLSISFDQKFNGMKGNCKRIGFRKTQTLHRLHPTLLQYILCFSMFASINNLLNFYIS
jgi:hypothetical protein